MNAHWWSKRSQRPISVAEARGVTMVRKAVHVNPCSYLILLRYGLDETV